MAVMRILFGHLKKRTINHLFTDRVHLGIKLINQKAVKGIKVTNAMKQRIKCFFFFAFFLFLFWLLQMINFALVIERMPSFDKK